MKKVLGIVGATLLGASSAAATDLAAPPLYTKAPVVTPAYDWGGWYVGGSVGGASESTNASDSESHTSTSQECPPGDKSSSYDGKLTCTHTVTTKDDDDHHHDKSYNHWYGLYNWCSKNYNNSHTTTVSDPPRTITTTTLYDHSVGSRSTGLIGGVQIGHNWQFAPSWVFGLEVAFDGANLHGNGVDSTGSFQATSKIDWITMASARLGYAANNWLFYGKGGAAWVHESLTLADLNNGGLTDASGTRFGWLAGAGIEYGLTRHWTVRVDYSHIGLNDLSVTGPAFSTPGAASISRDLDIVMGGVNYRF